MQILVTGGAGYIGSHTAKALASAGHEPVVLDNLSHGHRSAVRWGPFVQCDLADQPALREVFRTHRFDAVIHFAAFISVGESMQAPDEYFRNNLVNAVNLLDAMRENGVSRIVFSSTAAVYGPPREELIPEDHPTHPLSPYGESKLMVERLLHWYGTAYDLQWIALRYFNAAGADADGDTGELHHPETHLIPLAIAAAHGDVPELQLFGSDYPTPDGTAVRDYIHVADLASAHVKAVERLIDRGAKLALNLGTGQGHTVQQVIRAVEQVGQTTVPVRRGPRRPGDAPVLVADPSRARDELGWRPQSSSLQSIVETAWRWYTTNRRGASEAVADDLNLEPVARSD